MGFNLAQICCDPPSSSSSTTKIFCNENFNKCSPCRVPCCCKNSILNDHTYSILKRICHKIIKSYNRQQCREKYTVFDGGNSIGPRWSDRHSREDGSEVSNSYRQRGREYNNDPSGRDGRIDLNARNRHDNRGYSVDERGSGRLRKIKGRTDDEKDTLRTGKEREEGRRSRKSRSKKNASDTEQLAGKSKKRGDGKDENNTRDSRKSERGKGRKSKSRRDAKGARDSEAAGEKEGKSKGRSDKKSPGSQEASGDKQRKSKNRNDKKNAASSDGAADNYPNDKKRNDKKNARDSGATGEKDGKSKARSDKKSPGSPEAAADKDPNDKKHNDKKNARESGATGEKDGKSKARSDKKSSGSPEAAADKDPNDKSRIDKKNATDKKTTGSAEEKKPSNKKGEESADAIKDKERAKDKNPNDKKIAASSTETGEKDKARNDKKSAKVSEEIGEKGKQGKYAGEGDKKHDINRGYTESDTKAKDGKVGPLDDKKTQLSKDKNNSKSERSMGSRLDENKKGDANRINMKSKRDSKGKSRWDYDNDQEIDRKYRKGGKGKGGDDVSHLLRLSGRRGEASGLSGTKKRHGSQSMFRRHSSRIRNGIKGSKFIQYERRSRGFQRPTRGDEVRTCDILRVHLEQRDLARCPPCQLCPCNNVCGTCMPCLRNCC